MPRRTIISTACLKLCYYKINTTREFIIAIFLLRQNQVDFALVVLTQYLKDSMIPVSL